MSFSRRYSWATSTLRVSQSFSMQIVAAVPMACPVTKHPGITRMELCMYRSVLTQRPATSTLDSVPVDIGLQTTKSAGHHVLVFISFFKRSSSSSGQVSVARAVEIAPSFNSEETALSCQDRRGYPSPIRFYGDQARPKPEVHVHFLEQVVIDTLQHFRSDCHVAARAIPADSFQAALDLFSEATRQVALPI